MLTLWLYRFTLKPERLTTEAIEAHTWAREAHNCIHRGSQLQSSRLTLEPWRLFLELRSESGGTDAHWEAIEAHIGPMKASLGLVEALPEPLETLPSGCN
jgi:hypothetical protein